VRGGQADRPGLGGQPGQRGLLALGRPATLLLDLQPGLLALVRPADLPGLPGLPGLLSPSAP
jgi:hypothetical protein